jgi:lysozyme family protein
MSVAAVHRMAREIVAREGGFVDHPDDPGGATKHGVTIHTLQRLGLDLDGDGDTDADDVRRLTVEDAVRIFVDRYHRRSGIWRLPAALQPSVFDMQVNAGGNAGLLLQRVLNDAGFGPLAVDGVIGPATAAAAERAHAGMGALLVDAYGIARRDYYYRIADRNPRLRSFAMRRDRAKGGWIRRAEEFISAGFHLSDAEHRERIATWA